MADLKKIHAPIFPLPTLNLFPETNASYHVFEPRYKEMVEGVIEGNKFIAMAVLKPGYEDNYYGSPEIYPVGCLGKLSSYENLEDGTYNIVLQGQSRVGFGKLIQDNPYRVGEMELLTEKDYNDVFQEEREQLLLRLHYLVEHSPENMDFSPILEAQDSFVSLINLVARTLPLKPKEHYELLALDYIRQRAEKVLWHIDDHIETIELLKRVDPQITSDVILN